MGKKFKYVSELGPPKMFVKVPAGKENSEVEFMSLIY